jgi:hypothetical protein
MTTNERASSANPYIAEVPDSAWTPMVDPTKSNKSLRDVRLTWAQQKLLLADLFEIGPSLTAFSEIRTSNTAIAGDEFRLPYDCAAGDITPTMPTASNGRALWFYNDGATNNLIITNVEGSITETLTPGQRVALVGNGTIWRYQ